MTTLWAMVGVLVVFFIYIYIKATYFYPDDDDE